MVGWLDQGVPLGTFLGELVRRIVPYSKKPLMLVNTVVFQRLVSPNFEDVPNVLLTRFKKDKNARIRSLMRHLLVPRAGVLAHYIKTVGKTRCWAR